MIDSRPRCLRGKYGVYLCYYLANLCWIRLLGNLNEEQDSWISFGANPDTWLPIAALHISVWEANTDWYEVAKFKDRDDAWLFARTEARKKQRNTIHNEWFDPGDQMWNVNSVHPKAVA